MSDPVESNHPSLRVAVDLRLYVASQPSLRPCQPSCFAAEKQIAACVGRNRSTAGDFAEFSLAEIPRGSPQLWQEYIALNIDHKHVLVWGSACRAKNEQYRDAEYYKT
ncbi:MAG: hypothetical protein WBX38_18585 [Candidatus Sulfotelmatobacter sp.]